MFEKSLRNTPVISHTVNNEATNLAQVVRVFIAHLLAADSAPAFLMSAASLLAAVR
jgi:hypothetical protein